MKGEDGKYSKTFKDVAPGQYSIIEVNTEVEGYNFIENQSVIAGEATVENGKTATIELLDVYEQKSQEQGDEISFTVNKVDAANSEEVDDAVLILLNQDTEEEIDNWTSKKGEVHDFGAKMEVGKSYILRETVAPQGYGRVTTDILITISETGEVETELSRSADEDGNPVYLVEDNAIKATLELVDGNEQPLKNGRFTLRDKDGNVIGEWTSDGGSYSFGHLLRANEEYTIHEEETPDGYNGAPDVKFSVAEDGTIDGVDENGNIVVENDKGTTPDETPVENPNTAVENEPTDEAAAPTEAQPTDTDDSTEAKEPAKAEKAKSEKDSSRGHSDGGAGTGDGTPIGMAILMLLASLTAIGGVAVAGMRRRMTR